MVDPTRHYQPVCKDCGVDLGDPQRTRAGAERVRRRHERTLGHATAVRAVDVPAESD
jgi:hypothetical protein